MRMPTKFALTVVSLILLGSTPSALAASFGGSFLGRGAGAGAILAPSDSAGVIPQIYWNNIDSGDPVVDGTSPPLLDSAGSFTDVRIIYDANDAWNSDGGTATPNERLMKGIIKANPDPDDAPIDNTEKMVFVITNLSASGTYNVIVYSMENGDPAFAEMNVTLGATTYYIVQQRIF